MKKLTSEDQVKICQSVYNILNATRNCDSIILKYIDKLKILNKLSLKEDATLVDKYIAEKELVRECFGYRDNFIKCYANLFDYNYICDDALFDKEVNFVGSDFNITTAIDISNMIW